MKEIRMDYKEYQGLVDTIERQKKALDRIEQQSNVILIDKIGYTDSIWCNWFYSRADFPTIKAGEDVEPYLMEKIKEFSRKIEGIIEDNQKIKKKNTDLEKQLFALEQKKIREKESKKWWNIF